MVHGRGVRTALRCLDWASPRSSDTPASAHFQISLDPPASTQAATAGRVDPCTGQRVRWSEQRGVVVGSDGRRHAAGLLAFGRAGPGPDPVFGRRSDRPNLTPTPGRGSAPGLRAPPAMPHRADPRATPRPGVRCHRRRAMPAAPRAPLLSLSLSPTPPDEAPRESIHRAEIREMYSFPCVVALGLG